MYARRGLIFVFVNRPGSKTFNQISNCQSWFLISYHSSVIFALTFPSLFISTSNINFKSDDVFRIHCENFTMIVNQDLTFYHLNLIRIWKVQTIRFSRYIEKFKPSDCRRILERIEIRSWYVPAPSFPSCCGSAGPRSSQYVRNIWNRFQHF